MVADYTERLKNKKKRDRSIINKLDWAKFGIFELTSRLEDLQLLIKNHGMPIAADDNIQDLLLTIKAMEREGKKLREIADGIRKQTN
tara:strand:- start:2607 stop:2867 length:261 start_codon:yes stop_codon:yes gene_type:complete